MALHLRVFKARVPDVRRIPLRAPLGEAGGPAVGMIRPVLVLLAGRARLLAARAGRIIAAAGWERREGRRGRRTLGRFAAAAVSAAGGNSDGGVDECGVS